MTTRTKWQHYWKRRDKKDRVKCNIRWMDRYFFKKHLSEEMYNKYEIHHDWKNGAVCFLFTPFKHRGAEYKGNRNLIRGT